MKISPFPKARPPKTKILLIENSKKAIRILASNGILTSYFFISLETGDAYIEAGSSPIIVRHLNQVAKDRMAKSVTLNRLRKQLEDIKKRMSKKSRNRAEKVAYCMSEIERTFS